MSDNAAHNGPQMTSIYAQSLADKTLNDQVDVLRHVHWVAIVSRS